MLTRTEVGAMSETGLLLAADRLRDRLATAWRRGEPGKLTDLYDLALIYADANVRSLPLPAPVLPGQLELFRRAAVA